MSGTPSPVAPPAGAAPGAPAAPSTADLLYDALVSAAVGGSVLALFFFALDAAAGRPLFTPSLIGTVLFTGADPASVSEIRLDMVAYFTVVHLAAFLGLAAAVGWLGRRTGLTRRPAPQVALALFAALCAGSLGIGALAMPGLIAVLGAPWILAGNAAAAGAMALFLRWAHRDGG